jgi:hypothetical protein
VGSKLLNLYPRKLSKVVELILSIRRLLVIKLVRDTEVRENRYYLTVEEKIIKVG